MSNLLHSVWSVVLSIIMGDSLIIVSNVWSLFELFEELDPVSKFVVAETFCDPLATTDMGSLHISLVWILSSNEEWSDPERS